ncbi:MAG: M3 family oligoendopeptidase [Gaiellaceae bacterium MAG52_C11]|nr:M3 family oligoendopeptidase [Candidatus Gaiellasilicea maunaloa]
MSATVTGAEQVEWNLEDLYESPDDPRLQQHLDEASAGATAFRERYRGTLGELSGHELANAVAEAERLRSIATRVETYARLRLAADSSDQSRGALVQKVREQNTQIETELLFFDLEWAGLEDEVAERLLAEPALERYASVLRSERRYRPHLLSEPEEKISAEKSLTGANAWGRLFNELLSDLTVSLDGESVSLDTALAQLSRLTEQSERAEVAEAVTETLRPGLRTRGYILNTILSERAVEDRLRGYESWISARNLANEISNEAAQSLVDTIVDRYDIPRRFYALKARLLDLPRLADYDRFAPLQETPGTIPWEEARALVHESFDGFSPVAGEIVGRFFECDWIDAPPRPGKILGAFCATLVPDVHPYVLMNYAGERRSVLTLAHELGHGLHGVLAQDLGLLNASTALTLAETASVFAEALTFEKLREREEDPRARLDLLVGRIDDTIATVFRQVALNRFEHAIHTGRRDEGELSVDRVSELWRVEQERLLGDSVEVTENYGLWWSYVPHFIAAPGYVYAYAFGYLFSLAIYRRYQEEGDSLVEPYLDLLRAGGSAPPAELASRLGFDLGDSGFWAAGVDAIGVLVDEAEALAAELDDTK